MKRLATFLTLLAFALRIAAADDTGTDPLAGATEDTGQIQNQIEQAAKEGQKQVVIAPGVYRLTAKGPGKEHLSFENMKDLEIVATGVTLIFNNPFKNSIRFSQCHNVTLRGATLLRDPMPFSQGKITAFNDNSVDVQIDAGYPMGVENARLFPSVSLNLYDSNRHWLASTSKNKKPFMKLGPDTFRFFPGGGKIKADEGWAVGAPVAWRGRGGPDIGIDGCGGMKIIGVTIENGAGFCVREADGEGNDYYNYTITRGPKPPGATADQILASNADGFHSYAMRHGPTLENCHFEAMDDDGIAIHGKYGLVEEAQGNDIIIRHGEKSEFARVGDTIRFDDERGAFACEGKVTAIATDDNYTPTQDAPADLREFQGDENAGYYKVTLDQALPVKFGWLADNANANGDGFTIRGCSVRYNRARGFLIKASDGLIENCSVEGSSQGGIVVSPEMEHWNESDFARNVIIRHNTLTNEAIGKKPTSAQSGALTIEGYEHGHFVPLPGGHRNITVEDNTFNNNDGTQIVLTSAQDVTIQNNHFVSPMQHENPRGSGIGINPGALIWLTECSGVKISGNTVSNPGPYFKKDIDATPTASGTGFQDGVTQQ